MKKVLSVLLAAAMVMGMAVSSFAATATYGNGAGAERDLAAAGFDFGTMFVARENKAGEKEITFYTANISDKGLEAGDTLYFELWAYDNFGTPIKMNSDIPSNWVVKVSNSAAVDSASFYKSVANDVFNDFCVANGLTYTAGERYLKVQLADGFTAADLEKVTFSFYMYDTKNKVSSDKEYVEFKVNKAATTTYTKEYVNANDLDWVLSVDKNTEYKYHKEAKAKVATLDFYSGLVLADMKFYPGESYKMMAKEEYQKALSKEYDADISSITLTGIENATVVFPSAKDNKQLVEIVDGELVAVEVEYVTEYKFNAGAKAKGYLVEGLDAGVYALIDADVEIAVEEEAPVETPVEADKANPETGAADFVGAAVAMAVVSVAAAGALALKK